MQKCEIISAVPAKCVGVHAEGKAVGRLKAVVAAAVGDEVGGLLGGDGEPGCKVDHACCQRLRLPRQTQPHPRFVRLRSLAHVMDLHQNVHQLHKGDGDAAHQDRQCAAILVGFTHCQAQPDPRFIHQVSCVGND